MLTQREIERINRLAMQLKRNRGWEDGKRLEEMAERLSRVLAERRRGMRRH
jgi:hypothetical protein